MKWFLRIHNYHLQQASRPFDFLSAWLDVCSLSETCTAISSRRQQVSPMILASGSCMTRIDKLDECEVLHNGEDPLEKLCSEC